MKRYYDLNQKTYNNYCDEIDSTYMIEIPDDGKPYGLIEGEVADISETAQYIEEQKKINDELTKKSLENELKELDIKRIRAIAEPQLKNTESGETWLEYYTKQIQSIRERIALI